MKVYGRLAVDTNAVIAYREGIPIVCTLIEEADTLFLPTIVMGELFYGSLNSAKPKKNEQAVRKFSEQSALVPIAEAIATRYATVRLKLKKMGHPIPENDIWVAATCLELGVPLLTRDGTIEKVSDFFIFHPSYPTFSSCLQIVNYHKVIPHRLPVKTHFILTQKCTKTSKTAITRVKRR